MFDATKRMIALLAAAAMPALVVAQDAPAKQGRTLTLEAEKAPASEPGKLAEPADDIMEPVDFNDPNVSGHKAVLSLSGVIRGRLGYVRPGGERVPVTDVEVSVIRDGALVGRAKPTASGSFEVPGLSRGIYTLVVAGPGGLAVVSFEVRPFGEDVTHRVNEDGLRVVAFAQSPNQFLVSVSEPPNAQMANSIIQSSGAPQPEEDTAEETAAVTTPGLGGLVGTSGGTAGAVGGAAGAAGGAGAAAGLAGAAGALGAAGAAGTSGGGVPGSVVGAPEDLTADAGGALASP